MNNNQRKEPTVSLTVRVSLAYKNMMLDKAKRLELTMSDLVWGMLRKADKISAGEVANMPKTVIKQQEDRLMNEIIEEKKNLNRRNVSIYSSLVFISSFLLVNVAIFTSFHLDVIEKTATQTLFIFFLVFFAVNSLKNTFAKDKTE